MTDSIEFEEWFDSAAIRSAVAHQTALARTADQLRWASIGALEFIDRELLPAGVIDFYEDDGIRREYLDRQSPAVQQRYARIEHHRGAIWLSLTSIINAAGNISKLLWGKEDPDARSRLRRQLNQPDDWRIATLGERQFRNHFEHQDERLLTYLREQRDMLRENPSAGRFLSSRIIASERARTDENGRLTGPAIDAFGWWAPDVDKLWFLEDELDLGKLLREVIDIGDLANAKQKELAAMFSL